MQKLSDIKIAVTGTIGSGKSSVCSFLRDLGYEVFISDEYNAALLEIGHEGYSDIVKHFDVLDDDKKINKKKLAEIVFSDPSKLRLLESFTTDRIVKKIKELLKENRIHFFEIPLLYELKLESLFDRVIVITADDEIRIQRLIKRGINETDARNRISHQLSDPEKINKADIVIFNNGSLNELYDKIKTIIEEL